MIFISKLTRFILYIPKALHLFITEPLVKSSFGNCGKNTKIGGGIILANPRNISIGHDTCIGPECLMYASLASLTIGNYVMISPRNVIITGNHRTDVIGEYMIKIGNDQKLPENDKPVTIEDDVWIGSNCLIMAGVTIGRGSIVHGGQIVNKNIQPYTIYISDKLKIKRFTEEQIQEHERMLKKKYGGKI